MTWNWQQSDWPHFTFSSEAYTTLEANFLKNAGVIVGAMAHVPKLERLTLTVDLITQETLDSSAIEGEVLDRESVQSSLARQLGLQAPLRRSGPKETGAVELMADVYRGFDAPLDQDRLYAWHGMLMNGRRDLSSIGRYRNHSDAMQIVSGPIGRETIHFEAPPSDRVPDEMNAFLDWFKSSSPTGSVPLPAVIRAAVAHLWFESIHPFEDGNGRIGRAIAELALAQATSAPSLTVLSEAIKLHRRAYYAKLHEASLSNKIDPWIEWFGETVLAAQQNTRRRVLFVIAKTRMLTELQELINARQERALLRLFEVGPNGFAGGLSASNYQKITGASPATATRDLVNLVDLGAIIRTGENRNARYWLNWENE
ncbi:Fic family protein [Aquidulcibacter paucihalophilus]|uniref:Fic family protein n=1 Tax=Aquidulcibacter paucihalophilus TaxID=1978549 RepID=UPI000A19122F|nr:Fic family protein [Aquidulcibacter paucihalophilus]